MSTAPRLPSIRSRLSLTLIGWWLLWGLLISLGLWLVVLHEVDELLDDTLQASAEVLSELLDRGSLAGLPAAAPAGVVAAVGAASSEARFAWQIVGAGSQVLRRSARAPERPLMPLPSYGFADSHDHWRVYGVRFGDGERVLYVAQTRAERREAQLEIAVATVGVTLMVGLVAAAWIGLRIRRELAPLQALTDALAHYEPLVPGARLPPPTRRELAPIVMGIEQLGVRLARRVANERAFSAHAAHALRTPLAGLDAQLALAQRESPPGLTPRVERMRQATGRLTRVVAALLALFRSGVEVQWEAVDAAQLLARLPVEGLALDFGPPGSPHGLRADADLLTAALLNLLDNAVRYGAKRLHLSVQGQSLTLRDDGRGVEPERLAELQDALDTQAYEGRMGLGLMLADLVARAHGGRVHLRAADGGGLAVTLQLGDPPPEG